MRVGIKTCCLHMDRVPDEILLEFFGFLKSPEIPRIFGVCKRWLGLKPRFLQITKQILCPQCNHTISHKKGVPRRRICSTVCKLREIAMTYDPKFYKLEFVVDVVRLQRIVERYNDRVGKQTRRLLEGGFKRRRKSSVCPEQNRIDRTYGPHKKGVITIKNSASW